MEYRDYREDRNTEIQTLLLGGGGAIRRGSPLQGIQSLQKIQEIQRLYYWMGGVLSKSWRISHT